MQSNPIEIATSKSKIIVMILGAIAFVAAGIWFVAFPPAISNPVIGNRIFLAIVGSISILFFGAGGLFLLKRLISNTPGLIISDEGLTDNSSGVSIGFIPGRT